MTSHRAPIHPPTQYLRDGAGGFPAQHYTWECAPTSQSTAAAQPFEFVLVDATPELGALPPPAPGAGPFAAEFAKAGAGVRGGVCTYMCMSVCVDG